MSTEPQLPPRNTLPPYPAPYPALYGPTGAPYGQPASPYGQEPPTSGKAVASMVVSLVGLFFCLFIGQIIGIILGHAALREIRATGMRGEGLAMAGIIIGWVGIVIDLMLVLVYGFVIAMVIIAESQ